MDLYTHGIWIVEPGREDDFISAWHALGEWTLEQFPDAHGTLLQDTEQKNRFHSFGPWESLEQIQRWRSSDQFKEAVANMQELIESFEPRTMQLVVTIKREG